MHARVAKLDSHSPLFLGDLDDPRVKSHCTRAWSRGTFVPVTKTSWGTYVRAISDNQSEIAERMGTSQSTVSRWMRDDVVPSAELVIKLARAYGLSPIDALVAAGYL